MEMFRRVSLIFGVWIILPLFHQATCLEITNFFVPKEAAHEANIDCKYRIEQSEKFYDVKWYKDDQHFYTCAADGSVYEYPVEGVKTYHPASASMGSCPVTLVALTSKSDGEYKCEVNLDHPQFSVAAQSRHMTMIMPSARKDQRGQESSTHSSLDRSGSGKNRNNLNVSVFFLFIFVYHNL